jgi:N-acetylneuraminic acid mutarotase
MRRSIQSWDLDCLEVGALTLLSGAGVSQDELISFDDLFKFSTATMTWSQLDPGVTGTGLSARSELTMTSVGWDIYIFGGDDLATGGD